jgi:hypothetical protein
MKSPKNHNKYLVACIALISITVLLNAGYYKPDFFPIGLTGLNLTGSYYCPYNNVQMDEPWDWTPEDNPNYNEQDLIFDLGVNCLGSEDANRYIGSFDTTMCRNQNNYLYKVCIPSFMDDGDSANPERIYIIEFVDITELIDSLIADSLTDSLHLEE